MFSGGYWAGGHWSGGYWGALGAQEADTHDGGGIEYIRRYQDLLREHERRSKPAAPLEPVTPEFTPPVAASVDSPPSGPKVDARAKVLRDLAGQLDDEEMSVLLIALEL